MSPLSNLTHADFKQGDLSGKDQSGHLSHRASSDCVCAGAQDAGDYRFIGNRLKASYIGFKSKTHHEHYL
jgi:hypothetical protein